jgi:hypothetical protein
MIGDLAVSTTLYVGNLSFYTTEEQIHEYFRRCGPVKRVIMGLNKNDKTPCGFCFVESVTSLSLSSLSLLSLRLSLPSQSPSDLLLCAFTPQISQARRRIAGHASVEWCKTR